MRCIPLTAILCFAWALSAEVTRVSTPTIGIVADPVSGRLLAVEGVRGRLNLGRELSTIAVEAAWPAAEVYALVKVEGSWRLLEWNRDWVLTRTLDLGLQDWASVVWNPASSAWLACGDATTGCAIYRASDGAMARKLASKEPLRAVALADNATEALLQRGSVGLIWGSKDMETTVIEGVVAAAAFLPGQSRLAVAQGSGSLLLLDAARPNPAQIEIGEGAVGTAWAPDGRQLFIAYRDGTIRLYDDAGQNAGIANCECQPGGIWPMGKSGMFRLQENTKQQLFFVGVEDGVIQFSMLPGQEREVL